MATFASFAVDRNFPFFRLFCHNPGVHILRADKASSALTHKKANAENL